MKSDVFEAGGTVAQTFGSSTDAQVAAARLRGAGFADVRLSEADGRTTEEHINPAGGATELDFEALLEQAGFGAERAQEVTKAVARGAVLLTVAAGRRAADAAAVLRGQAVAAQPLSAVDVAAVPVDVAAPAGAAHASAADVAAPAAPVTAVSSTIPDDGAASLMSATAPPGAPPVAAAGGVEAGDRVIPLRAEQLEIGRERVTHEARIRKEVVTEQQTVTVPVEREQLVIERDGERTVRIPLSDR